MCARGVTQWRHAEGSREGIRGEKAVTMLTVTEGLSMSKA